MGQTWRHSATRCVSRLWHARCAVSHCPCDTRCEWADPVQPACAHTQDGLDAAARLRAQAQLAHAADDAGAAAYEAADAAIQAAQADLIQCYAALRAMAD
jgi:hypothetical protein